MFTPIKEYYPINIFLIHHLNIASTLIIHPCTRKELIKVLSLSIFMHLELLKLEKSLLKTHLLATSYVPILTKEK